MNYAFTLDEVPRAGLFRVRSDRHVSCVHCREFLNSPYALIVDVRMLNFFRYLNQVGTIAAATYRTIKARFEHRLVRLERKAGRMLLDA